MKDILNMMVLGVIAGGISIFWTRVASRGMILSFVFRWMEKLDRKHILKTGRGYSHPLNVFFSCMFCITPWLVFILMTFYIISYTPYWMSAIIGVFGALGAGNFVCELVHALRNEQ